jgi:hypothetical protein
MQCIEIKTVDLFPEESTTLSVMRILEEADVIPPHHHQTPERIVRCPLADLTGHGTAPSPPTVWLNAFQEITRNRVEIYMEDI